MGVTALAADLWGVPSAYGAMPNGSDTPKNDLRDLGIVLGWFAVGGMLTASILAFVRRQFAHHDLRRAAAQAAVGADGTFTLAVPARHAPRTPANRSRGAPVFRLASRCVRAGGSPRGSHVESSRGVKPTESMTRLATPPTPNAGRASPTRVPACDSAPP